MVDAVRTYNVIPAVILVWACTVATWFDLRTRIIPNNVCYGALLLGGVYYAALPLIGSQTAWDPIPTVFAESLLEAIAGALLCAFALLPFWFMGEIGGGDVKFAAVLGLFLGIVQGLAVLGVGAVLALVFLFGKSVRSSVCSAWSARDHKQSDSSVSVQPMALPMAGFFSTGTLIIVLQSLI